MDLSKLKIAQSNLSLCAGIALGITAMQAGDVDLKKSYYENAVELAAEVPLELLKDMIKELQNKINEVELAERERLANEREDTIG